MNKNYAIIGSIAAVAVGAYIYDINKKNSNLNRELNLINLQIDSILDELTIIEDSIECGNNEITRGNEMLVKLIKTPATPKTKSSK